MEEVIAIWKRVVAPVLWVAATESFIPKWLGTHPEGEGGTDSLASVRARLAHVPHGRLVTVDEAMTDPAYRSRDEWTDGGVSWIERWGVTRGVSQVVFDHDPPASAWIVKLAGVKEE